MKFERHIRKSDTLFFLSVPPPYGGGEIVNQYLLARIKDKYAILATSRSSHTKSVQGRVNPRNIIEGIWLILVQAFYLVLLRPQTVFLGIPKDYFSFVRQSVCVHMAKLLGVRVVGDLHGMSFTFPAASSQYFRYTINKFQRMRVLGEEIKKEVRSTGYRNEIRVIDNGIEIPEYISRGMANFDGHTVKLLYLGAISESKGFLKVLDVFKELQRLFPQQLTIDIAGEFADTESKLRFENLVSEKQRKTSVRYHRRVLGDEKWKLLAESTLLLHFSRFDGQPLTIIEAMACGVPTIATRIGAIPEMITHSYNGFLVDDCQIETLEIVSGLLNGKIAYDQVSKNAKETFKKRFTIDRYVNDIEKLVADDAQD